MSDLARAFRAAMLVLSSVSFGTLVATGKMSSVLIVFGSLTLAIATAEAWFNRRVVTSYIPTAAWNGLVGLACLGTAIDYVSGSHDLLQASLAILVVLMANKAMTACTPHDGLHLFAVTFLQLLAAAVLTIDLWFGLAFVAYVIGAVWALVLYHLVTEAAAHQATDPASTSAIPFPRSFIVATTALALLTLSVTSTVFLVIPRTGFGFFQRPHDPTIKTAGFSEHVDLGVIGAVKQDRTLVLRVQLPDEPMPSHEPLYLRGAAYDLYTGESWVNTLTGTRLTVRPHDGVFEVTSRSPDSHRRLVRQDILMEALDTTVLFGLPVIKEIRGQFPALQTDGMGGVRLPYPLPVRFQYTVASAPAEVAEEDRRALHVDYPPSIVRHFLQLPRLDEKVPQLAQQMAGDASTPLAKVYAVKGRLLTDYRYTLDLESGITSTPLEDFLFSRKTGYCEHYATAMVVLLRTLGIPARLVTGFLSGTWNEFGHYYAVRQQDAHAWVEVYFPGSGWVTFDPTPAVVSDSPNPLLLRIASFVDALRLRWDRFIIHYSFRDQMHAAQDLQRQVQQAQHRAMEALAALRQALGDGTTTRSFFALLAMIAVAAACWRLMAGRWDGARRRRATSSSVPASDLYVRLLSLLERQGFSKAAGITPREFAEQVPVVGTDARACVKEVTELYYRARFGGTVLSEDDRQRADELLSTLARLSGSSPPVSPESSSP